MPRHKLSRLPLRPLVILAIIVGGILHTFHVVHHWDIIHKLSETGKSTFKQTFYMNFIPTNTAKNANRFTDIKQLLKFKILTERLDICKPLKNTQIELFIFIMSRYGEVSLRKTIRKTWLSAFVGNKSKVRYIFLLATNTPGVVLDEIKREVISYQDVVMYDVVDSYQNLTLKTMLGMHFATKYCKSARNVMKTDSDVYVNLPPLLQKLRQRIPLEPTALGLLHVNATPIRNRTGDDRKWFVSEEEFTGSVYPAYLDGMGYVLPMPVVKDIVDVFPSVPFFRFEDVYIGMCMQKLGFKIQGTKGFMRSESVLTICSHKADTIYAVHGVAERLIGAIWRLNCTGMTNAVVRKPSRMMYKWVRAG